MLIAITLVLITIWIAFVTNMYAIINPFVTNIWDIKNYNIAYYGAISSVERAKLVLKYHQPWFEWSGWWLWTTAIWPWSDKINTWFSLISSQNNWMWYDIKSILTGWSIPQAWNWNIDIELRGTWSENYNKIEYKIAEEFAIDIDNTRNSSKYYTWDITWLASNQIFSWSSIISGSVRLPPKVYSSFSNQGLCTTCDLDNDGIWNDSILNWSIFWNYNSQNFTILPNISVNYGTNTVNTDDTNIREDVINDWTNNLLFTNNKNPIFKPATVPAREYNNITQNVIPPSLDLTWKNFREILTNATVTWVHLKFSLLNLLKNTNDQLYPFVEYRFQIMDGSGNPINIPDRFYHIYGNSKVWKYNVQIKLDTPISNTDSSSDFAILF